MPRTPANPERRPGQRYSWLWVLAGLLLYPAPLVLAAQAPDCATATQAKQLVIIIDDVGHSLKRGQQTLALPGKLNVAVIPYTPFGTQLAKEAGESGKEVLLHAPMSTLEDLPLGRGALTPSLAKQEFRAVLDAALAEIPQARGVNNHMGSDLTQRRKQMAWLMQELRGRDMYFVDSRTSDKTVGAIVAAEFRVPHLSRQVFLDNERSREAIDERFQWLLSRLEESPVAVAIGHPYPETIAYLQEALPRLAEQGIELAYVSDVLAGDPGLGVNGTRPGSETVGSVAPVQLATKPSSPAHHQCSREATT